MKKILLFIILISSYNCHSLEKLSQLKIKHKKDVQSWHNKYFKDKIQQEELSLYAQKIYYLFKILNTIFKSKTFDESKTNSILNTIKKIDLEISKIKHPLTSKAFIELADKLEDFKLNSDKFPEKSMFEFFNYIASVYEKIYKSLENKKITMGSDKNKNLPDKFEIPSQKEIENVFKKVMDQNLGNKRPNFKVITLKPVLHKPITLKPRKIKSKPLVLKPIVTKLPKPKVVAQTTTQPIQTSIPQEPQEVAPATQVPIQPTDTTETPAQPPAQIQPQPMAPPVPVEKPEEATSIQISITSSVLCPFINNFLTIPGIPKNVPKDSANLNIYVTNFNNSVVVLNQFITDYSNAVKDWEATNDSQKFSTLLKTMKDAQANYHTFKNTYDTCINNTPASTQTNCTVNKANYDKCVSDHGGSHPYVPDACVPLMKLPLGLGVPGEICVPLSQTACSNELTNYIDATNALYDSYAAVLDFLNNYNLAPSWANPLSRQYQMIGAMDSSGNQKVSIVNNKPIAINKVQGFDATSFTNQINAMMTYLKTNIQPCYDAIAKINNVIKDINTTIQTTVNTINTNVAFLKMTTPKPAPGQTIAPAGGVTQDVLELMQGNTDHLQQKIVGLSTFAFGTAYGLITSGAESLVALPAFMAAQEIINDLALVSGADLSFINAISAQINKDLINDWTFKDARDESSIAGKIAAGFYDLGKGALDIVKMFIAGPGTLAASGIAAITCTLTCSASDKDQAAQKAEQAGASLAGGLASSSGAPVGDPGGIGGFFHRLSGATGQGTVPRRCGTPDHPGKPGDQCTCPNGSVNTCVTLSGDDPNNGYCMC